MPRTKAPPVLLTISQAAERLGISAGALRIQAERGRLLATKYGSQWLVTEEETERYRREVSDASARATTRRRNRASQAVSDTPS